MAERRIGDEAVRARTGKSWTTWFGLLDRWKAKEKGHAATARYLGEKHGLSSWWAQAVTGQYERERAGREKYSRPKGYEISVSRVIRATPRRAFQAITKPEHLSQWFTSGARGEPKVGSKYSNRDGDRGTYLAVQPSKRVRFTWENPRHAPGTIVEITTDSTRDDRAQVRVTHSNLRDSSEARRMREAWSWALDSLRSYLETGAPIPPEDWKRSRQET
jgi:uncharacterized protein YndB with AHSA1/START domain